MTVLSEPRLSVDQGARGTDVRLRVSSATKRFGQVTALDSVDLEVRSGEIVALLGASGCGKTTLLRGIAGLTALDHGDVEIAGRDVTGLRPSARDVAMVFQDGALFPHLSAADNIAVGLPKGADRTAVQPVAELLQIGDLLDRRPSQLSGGQRQRVGIARALVRRPALMLMDEPFAALDADLRLELRREMRRLHRLGELAETVFVTHDQTEALGIADCIAVMRDGRIEQQGTPTDLLDSPATLPLARFLGVPRIAVLPTHRGITAAVRPTDLMVGSGALEATVETVSSEPFAGNWLVTSRLARGAEIDFVTPRDHVPVAGAKVVVSCSPDRVHTFRDSDGSRLSLTSSEKTAFWNEVTS
ncbi:MAG: ABC transporter ATP-binding protein [Ilumatobacter sp.]|uniref:ABC transporter ATP-binding protein n=1 Tax=Ilumatobacter sp. TaxID=1967498 RepID=UPI00391BF37F